MKKYFAGIILTACSSPINLSASEIKSEALISEISRIEPRLNWCDNGFAFARPNNITGKENCDVGDGMHFSGILLHAAWPNTESIKNSIRDSIGEDGQPWRAPSYKYVDAQNELSRDQWIGFLTYLLASNDIPLANKVISWVKGNNNSLCNRPTDGRCAMTLGMQALTDDVYKRIGAGAQYNVNRWLDEQLLIFEAKTVPPGYQANLIVHNVYMRAKIGKLTSNYARAVKIIADRFPANLWFAFAKNNLAESSQQKLDQISFDLLSCMQDWEMPAPTWAFNNNSISCKNASGTEYVWLAKLILQNNQYTFVPSAKSFVKFSVSDIQKATGMTLAEAQKFLNQIDN